MAKAKNFSEIGAEESKGLSPGEITATKTIEVTELIYKAVNSNDQLLFLEAVNYYSQAIKIAHESKNYVQQTISYQKLAEIYLTAKDYIKAITIYNFALAICNDPENNIYFKDSLDEAIETISNAIKNGEEKFLLSIPSLIKTPSPVELDEQHKAELKKIRDQAKIKLELQQETKKKVIDYLNSDEQSFHERELVAQDVLEGTNLSTEVIYKEITGSIILLIQQMIKECKEALGKAPCDYAVIGLGSLARSEATPYSDLEFAILLEEGKDTDVNKEYFRNLSKLLFINVINLGETTARAMNIESLSWLQESDSPTHVGFSIDGQMNGACKTPLGNIHIISLKDEEKFELLQTPSKMAEYHDENTYSNIDRHLTTVLSTFTVLDGNEQLVRDYAQKSDLILDQKSSSYNKTLKEQRALTLLEESTSKFEPKLGKHTDIGHYFNAKFDLYRLPNMIIDHLAYYYSLQTKNSIWERIDSLFGERGKFRNVKGAENLKLASSKILELRLRTYLENGYRGDILIPFDKNYPEKNKELLINYFHINQEELFEIYYSLIPLIDDVREFLDCNGEYYIFESSYYDESSYIKGEIFRQLLENNIADNYYQQACVESRNPRYIYAYANFLLETGKLDQAEKNLISY